MPWNETMRQEALERLKKHYSNAGPELTYSSPFQLLVAVVLSAQSTDRQVNQVTGRLFARAGKAEQLAALPLAELEMLIKGVGLYRTKARNLSRLSQILVEKHGGEVPQSFAELEALPGVGHKTASVVLAIAFGVPALAVDTHVFRVANRSGLATGRSVEEVEEQLKELISVDEWAKAHHWLLHHGRYCCTARRPACVRCPIFQICRTYCEEMKE